MGKRTVYEINDNEGNRIATLFSNSSHNTQFAEDVFDRLTSDPGCSSGPSRLVEKMLVSRYESSDGSHNKGDWIFCLIQSSESENGDLEACISATHVITEVLVGQWSVSRQAK